ncbi:MAG: C-terminal binding protein [Caldilineaceae bacterium SB0670_bin_27]|uniref:C-terminal binding protein n=1 Tax=Caldilineaceae bacterium SB0664_bin_27 TaxID=2605260 RepID=A0A6B0YR81_9CHLR|nr:C-terminal binding protein [Caldilineaceae bacterium SB0664_bin_27]MYJ77577.1 C-terminal binding protein [Caldilineaceae bacterium SB0670_bin_27]
MNMNVVIAYPGFGDIEIEQEILSAAGLEIEHVGNLDTEAAREAALHCDALMVTIQPVRADLIRSLERCRLICRVGTGLDAIDIEAATERGIWVTYAPDYSIDEVSTHAIALVMAQARGLPGLLGATRQGIWNSESGGILYRFGDQTLGVIGCGRIGQATAAKGRGLGLEVLVFDPYVDAAAMEELGVQVVDLETLLHMSDYISLHSPLTDETRHLINAETLAKMKPTAYLVNAARGALVDEDALLAAVQGGQIAGAALDVLNVEPVAADHPFLKEERILLTPHAGWYSEESKVDVRVQGAEEVVRVLRGERPRAPVNEVPNG